MGGVRAVGAAARTSVAGHLSPPAGEGSGAGRGRFGLSITGFGAGLRLEGGLYGSKSLCASVSLPLHNSRDRVCAIRGLSRERAV